MPANRGNSCGLNDIREYSWTPARGSETFRSRRTVIRPWLSAVISTAGKSSCAASLTESAGLKILIEMQPRSCC